MNALIIWIFISIFILQIALVYINHKTNKLFEKQNYMIQEISSIIKIIYDDIQDDKPIQNEIDELINKLK